MSLATDPGSATAGPGRGVERFAAMVGWDVTVIDGILEDECLVLYRNANVELTR